MAEQKRSKFGTEVNPQYSPYEDSLIPVRNSTAEVTSRYSSDGWVTEQKISNAVSAAYRRNGLEPPRHPLSARFHQLLAQAGEMHDAKQADYGLENDPFHNVRSSSDFGVEGWVGCMIRADDKMKRLKKFATRGELRNESVRDSFMDLAVYALIGLVLYEEEA